MGTRSTIQVNDLESETTIIFYKGYDGYPSDNLKMFKEAFKESKNVNDFLESCAKYYNNSDFNEMLEFCGPFELEAASKNKEYCQHWDIEYHYKVDFKNKNVDVYGGGYANEKTLKSRGLFNPVLEAENYIDSFQEEKRKQVIELLTELAAEKITVNKK